MTEVLTRKLLDEDIVDAKQKRVRLGDRALDLNSGVVCVVLDHCPELGPESLYVQSVDEDGPEMTFWVEPSQLVTLPRSA